MKNAYNKRNVLLLNDYRNLKLFRPEEYAHLEEKLIEELNSGTAYKTICKTYNVKQSVLNYIKEQRGMFSKGIFKGLSPEQITGYKRHMIECDARESDYTPVAEWLKQPKHVDDIIDPGEPGYAYSKAIETPAEPPIMDLLDSRLHVKTKPELPAATPDYDNDVLNLVTNDWKLYTALNTMLSDMFNGSKGTLSIAFDGKKVKGFSIETE